MESLHRLSHVPLNTPCAWPLPRRTTAVLRPGRPAMGTACAPLRHPTATMSHAPPHANPSAARAGRAPPTASGEYFEIVFFVLVWGAPVQEGATGAVAMHVLTVAAKEVQAKKSKAAAATRRVLPEVSEPATVCPACSPAPNYKCDGPTGAVACKVRSPGWRQRGCTAQRHGTVMCRTCKSHAGPEPATPYTLACAPCNHCRSYAAVFAPPTVRARTTSLRV